MPFVLIVHLFWIAVMLLSGGLFDAGGGGLFGPGAGEDTFLDGDNPEEEKEEDFYPFKTAHNRRYRYNKDYNRKRPFHPYNNNPHDYEPESDSDDSADDEAKRKEKLLRTKRSLLLVFGVCCCAFPLILYAPMIFYIPA